MGLLNHSLLSLFALLGTTPLTSARSVRRDLAPRQASSAFKCTYPDGWEMCNKDDDRGCWVKDPSGKIYGIDTDYEKDVPQGIERTYDLTIEEADISPDGFKRSAQVINGKYPGELIEACWGDTLIINVKNTIKANGTTIHFHGLRMLNENQMDGVNGVTQCPIADGDTFTYKFRLRQYGHSWYHSHYSAQYTDGLAAPIVIHGPNTANWTQEWSPIIVSDWYHLNAYDAFHKSLTGPPTADAIVVNGTGRSNKDKTGSLFQQTFKHNETYLIRVVNGGTDFHFHFSIDNHVLQVVSADLVPIEPFFTNSLSVGIGQRYGVIVHANQTSSPNGKYWIRTEYSTTCAPNNPNYPANNLDTQRVGIISYEDAGQGDPQSTRTADPAGCVDPVIKPHVKWQVTEPDTESLNRPHYLGLDNIKSHFTHGSVARWELAETPLWLNFSDPTLLHLDNTTWNPEYAVEPYNAKDPNGFVYMIINSGNGTSNMFGGTHPIHLHGHDFAVIKSGAGLFDPTKVDPKKDFALGNPPRRDVAMLQAGGHLVLAFKTDNPGVWLVHCHIGWHAGSGLALQVLERQGEISKTIGSLDPIKQGCNSWTQGGAGPKNWRYDWQEDSGI